MLDSLLSITAVLVVAIVLLSVVALVRLTYPRCPACRGYVKRGASKCINCGESLYDHPQLFFASKRSQQRLQKAVSFFDFF
jgi:predicted amidophosphoribosyltransferase